MYCPQCRAEYREGFLVCSTCEVALEEGGASPGAVGSVWTRETRLGTPGTRLVFLFVAQTALIVLGSLTQFPQTFYMLTAALGIAAIIAIFTRKTFTPYFIYAFLSVLLLIGVLALGVEIFRLFTFGLVDNVQLGGLFGTIAGGIALPLVWLVYFRRRRGIFIKPPRPSEER